MFGVLLFVTVIYTAVGFNIHIKPLQNYANDDPLFGQTIVQSKDGVYVPSPSKGIVFKCTFDLNCTTVYSETTSKGRRPITSISSIFSEEKEQLLICNQVRQKISSSEKFNGLCSRVTDDKELDKIDPADLVSKKLKNDALKHNIQQNQVPKYKCDVLEQKKTPKGLKRRKREAEQNNSIDEDEDDDDDEDAGTEIAFVLDGSGSINATDFKKAKDFISNVMSNVWKGCFSCNFAIVQFGSKVRTELSLQENDNPGKALEKVENIKQLGNLTKTADALYHVLTEVFVPENGSNPNSKKMVIVLSDGQMLGHQRNLTDVLNMPEMEGVTRFSIGVGPEVLDNNEAIKEMIQIAGSKENFYSASSYAALAKILDSLENNIYEIEGIQKGAGFLFELAEAGFSSQLTHEGSMLFGAVGAFDWNGGIILKQDQELTFFNSTTEEPRFSYLGYSVASAHVASKTIYISGAPRYNLTGGVFVFNGTNQYILQGDQVGSYFGAVLCTLDLDNDQETDYLLVGAPHFHEKWEEGKVVVYKLHQGKFTREDYELQGLKKFIYARFGSAIADIGDIDGNAYRDVAVGAPLEPAEDMPGTSGSIYIYNGFKDGLRQQFSQRISPSKFGYKLAYFGQAVSVMSGSLHGMQGPFISVGSEKSITIFTAIPVITIEPNIEVDPETIPFNMQTKAETFPMQFKICFEKHNRKIRADGEVRLQYQIDLDYGSDEKRLKRGDSHEWKDIFSLNQNQNCILPIDLRFMGCYDCFSPIKIRLNVMLVTNSSEMPRHIFDVFHSTEYIKEIPFQNDCRNQGNCMANISIAHPVLSSNLVIIGSPQTFWISFDFVNTGDSSYMTTLTLNYPHILHTRKIESGQCEVKNEDLQITCKLIHPVFKRNERTNVNITWQPRDKKSELTSANITAVLTSGNKHLASQAFGFRVKNALKVQLSGSTIPARITISEDEKSKEKRDLKFIFTLQGENKYKAKITVAITIKKTLKTEMTIKSIEPKTCHMSSDDKDMVSINCTVTDLQNIEINTGIITGDTEGTQQINATGVLSFDDKIYDDTGVKKKDTIVVSVTKLMVVKSMVPIIAGSSGGFILLIIIIIILIKCGFFRRRHKPEPQLSTQGSST